MGRSVPFLNGFIAIVAFVVAVVLVCYMLVAFVAGLFDIILHLLTTLTATPEERMATFLFINHDLLYQVAFLLVLMKAYSVLAGYLRTYTLAVKSVAEFIFVAAALQLLFNHESYSDHMQLMLAVVTIGLFAVYAFRYKLRTMLDSYVGDSVSVAEEATSSQIENNPIEPLHDTFATADVEKVRKARTSRVVKPSVKAPTRATTRAAVAKVAKKKSVK